jgi:hypothetical protein
MKIIGAVLLFGLVFISPAFGLQKTTTPGSSTVSCKCTCLAAFHEGVVETKTWTWTGTRADCQAYNGGDCKLSGTGAAGVLKNCDVEVQHAPPGTQERPPTTGTNKSQ